MPDALSGAVNRATSGAALGPWGAVAGGLLGAATGFFQKKKADKLLSNLEYPTEVMPSEVVENQNLARRDAATGLPSEQYANAMKNIQRQQLAALRSANDRRAGGGLIGGIQAGTNDALLNLDAEDARMKLDNEGKLIAANNTAAGWKSKLFDSNVRQKYIQDYNYAMGLKGAGNENFSSGLDKIGAGVGYGLDSGWFKGGGGGTTGGAWNGKIGALPGYTDPDVTVRPD